MIGNGILGAIKALIGAFTDFVSVPYSFGLNSIMAHLNTAYYHIHGQPFTYPKLADSVTLTSGAGAWGTGGAITEVIPANTLNVSAFDLHWINMINHSADAEYIIEIYKGAPGSEVLISDTDTWRDSALFGGEIGVTAKAIQVPQQTPNERISCKLYSSNVGAASLQVKFNGHYYA